MHTQNRYDTELLRRFAPCCSAIGSVSEASRQTLLDAGVTHPDLVMTARTGVLDLTRPLSNRSDGRARTIEILYTGRLDAYTKRVLALPSMIRCLREAGIDCGLSIVGEGPAIEMLQSCAEQDKSISLIPAMRSDELRLHYDRADLIVLPSRTEGLGLSRVEGALAGCVPLVAHRGGAAEGIEDGIDGLIAGVAPLEDDDVAAEALAARLAAAFNEGLDLSAMGQRARLAAKRDFSISGYLKRLDAVIELACNNEVDPQAWAMIEADPVSAASFSVPADAGSRAAALAERLGLRDVVLMGAGAHTAAIRPALAANSVRVVAVADDDPAQRVGLGVPVVSAAQASRLGADAVLISSWIHQEEMWSRRHVFEDAGMPVYRIYDAA
ncbi:MAG: glycosyltransferase [Planctomycetota bacterium]